MLSEFAGYVGAGLAGAAYVPQITHMIKEDCVAGISRPAFLVWLTASALILTRAIAVVDLPFMILGGVQVSATGFISLFITLRAGRSCGAHALRAP